MPTLIDSLDSLDPSEYPSLVAPFSLEQGDGHVFGGGAFPNADETSPPPYTSPQSPSSTSLSEGTPEAPQSPSHHHEKQTSARAASPPPPDREPTKPSPSFDLSKFPKLLTEHVGKNRILPWGDPALRLEDVVMETGPPPWSLSLESYYRAFHPHTWVCLKREYDTQLRYFSDLMSWALKRMSEGACTGEVEHLERKAEVQHEATFALFASLYGLHYLRERYLDHYRSLNTGWDDSKILNETLDFEFSADGFPCVSEFADHSVWPLPLPLSTIPGPPNAACNSLVCLADLSCRERLNYGTPKLDPMWHSTFRPMSGDEFLWRYQAKRAERLRGLGSCPEAASLAR
ncbi:hypothetical protein JCM6882_001387 [Rhodosporidiobolus microsporus]